MYARSNRYTGIAGRACNGSVVWRGANGCALCDYSNVCCDCVRCNVDVERREPKQMNGDLISREAAMLAIHNAQTASGWSNGMHEMDIHKALAKVPAVDAAPVVHGRWIDSNGAIRCSECLHTPLYDYHGRLKLSKACPTCGANMWKEREE